jgi:hypothetical protein
MLKHLARMRPMNRAVICPVTAGRLVHEADFARALMLWQRRKLEAITLGMRGRAIASNTFRRLKLKASSGAKTQL